MTFSQHLKALLPLALRRRLISAVRILSPGRDASRPFTLGAERRSAAKARFEAVDWHDASPTRIIYALTPTASLRNVGDHAQAVAIHRWLGKHYPHEPVVELDKDVAIACIDEIRARVRPGDRIFLHSGGNLGDRGQWSEAGRRLIISTFPEHRIVSLPQTIFFSPTPGGRSEQEKSRAIYAGHPALTVLGRDRVSGQLADDLFPGAQTGTYPDFVLSLELEAFGLGTERPPQKGILACLRRDDESVLDERVRVDVARKLGPETTLFDTTLDDPIPSERRLDVLRDTLSLFAAHEAVVTDRYHGLIFAVICRKPVVVLPTVDHKLHSAIEWFSDIANVGFSETTEDVADTLARVRDTRVVAYPDFNALYFDRLPAFLEGLPAGPTPS